MGTTSPLNTIGPMSSKSTISRIVHLPPRPNSRAEIFVVVIVAEGDGQDEADLARGGLAVGGAAPAVHRLVKKERIEINVGRDFGVEIGLVFFGQAGLLPLRADIGGIADDGGVFGQVNLARTR